MRDQCDVTVQLDPSARRPARSPLVTADGFAPGAIVVDPATGCQLWQAGCTVGGVPIATMRGRQRSLRQLVWEWAGRPLEPTLRLTTTCGQPRCLALAHLVPIVAAPKPDVRPRRRSSPLQPQLAMTLPKRRPEWLSAREWTVLVGIRDGRTLRDLAAELGVSRQRVSAIAHEACRKSSTPKLRSAHQRLTDAQLAAIAWADSAEPTVDLAARLDAPYATVQQARRRIERAGGWGCRLARRRCAACGQPLLSNAAAPRRIHHRCKAKGGASCGDRDPHDWLPDAAR